MRQLTCLITTVSFFTVTILEKGMLIICILVSCGFHHPVEATAAKSGCVSCCASTSSCGQNESENSNKAEKEELRLCQIFLEISVSYRQRCECNLLKPNLTATYEHHKTNNFRINEIQPGKIHCDCARLADILADQSRPRGVHFAIPTTVLRI